MEFLVRIQATQLKLILNSMKLDELYKKIIEKKEIKQSFLALDENNSSEAGAFFKKYGGAVWLQDPLEMSYDKRDHFGRISAYLDLLNLIDNVDHEKFLKIHKGTPYCLLGWLFIDIGDYERGIFYLDAAVSEDVRVEPTSWQLRPAPKTLFLDNSDQIHIARRIIDKICSLFNKELKFFNSNISVNLSLKELIDEFAKPNIQAPSHRTLICSLFVFILENQARQDMLKRRSIGKGTIEPFLLHLYKGTLILESILKEAYSSFSGLTLGKILNDPFVARDLDVRLCQTGGVCRTLDDISKNLLPYLEKNSSRKQDEWLTIALSLRNVTSHSLLWPDIFNENTYYKLYRHVLYSIFYIIHKKFSSIV